jgi:NTP pyrophosphatase (non-canonical NTP hydrolase)
MLEKKGLVKLVEECGELIQIASKKMAYMGTDSHPDCKGSLKQRLEEEAGDVMGAIFIVIDNFGLDSDFILKRSNFKAGLFQQWMEEPVSDVELESVMFCGKVCATRNEYETSRCTLEMGHSGTCYDSVNN